MEPVRIIRSAGIVSGFTLLSRGLGLARDVLMAGVFGTTLPMSAFVVAFTIPNLFRRLFGEGALSAAFVPVFIQTRDLEGAEAAWRLARRILTLLVAFLSAVTVLGLLGITLYLAGVEVSEQLALTLSLLRIMLPYLLLICFAALCMAILNAYHHFATSAFAPSLLNIVWIAALLLLCPLLGDQPQDRIYGVAWAVLFAGLLQCAVQLPVMYRFGYRAGWSFEPGDARVRRVLRLMGPASLGMAITQINVLLDKMMAAWIAPWAPAAMFFSERLIYFPQGIFATALSTVLLPVFSGHAARTDHARILTTINFALRNLLYVMIPAAVGLWVLARPIVQMVFEWRTFGAASTVYTTTALLFYAPGLMIFSLSKVFVPAFYALQDTRTPVRVACCTVGLKLALSLLFILTWPLELRHGGLALATVLAEGVHGVALAVLLQRRIGSPGWASIFGSAARVLAGSVVMAVTALGVHGWLTGLLAGGGSPDKFMQILAVLGAIGAAVAAYFLTTLLLRSPEIRPVWQALRTRLGR